MKKIGTKLPGVYIIEPQVFGDQRGYFMETWSTRNFEEMGLNYNFVQDNQSFSSQKGILRGIHFQNAPMAQAKLVRVTRGAVLDVAVDLRKGLRPRLQNADGRRGILLQGGQPVQQGMRPGHPLQRSEYRRGMGRGRRVIAQPKGHQFAAAG